VPFKCRPKTTLHTQIKTTNVEDGGSFSLALRLCKAYFTNKTMYYKTK